MLPDLTNYFGRDPLSDPSISKADIVLALFRTGHRDAARALLGVSSPHISPPPHPDISTIWEQSEWVASYLDRHPTRNQRRVFTYVDPNPRLPGRSTKVDGIEYERTRRIRRGMTVEQALARGVRDYDIRHALRMGWVRIEERAA